MNLQELKAHIENNTLKENLLIFTGDGDFIFKQYLHKYVTDNSLDIKYIESIDEISSSNMFAFSSNVLYLLETDTFIKEPASHNRVWVKCKKNKSKTDSIELPKLEEWQLEDYIKSKCFGLKDSEVKELLKCYKDNPFRLDLELDKILITGTYKYIKDQLYTDVANYMIFDLTTALVKRDKKKVSDILIEIEHIDVEPFGLLTLMTKNFRQLIDIQLAINPTAESVRVSDKQFWVLKKYNSGYYNREELVKIYKWLLDIDKRIKNGELDTKYLNEYIITKIINI
jgi:hypothetical protein|nr:MAG TPA: DNA polymerase III, delta subunit [Caudoviricetes sp.]